MMIPAVDVDGLSSWLDPIIGVVIVVTAFMEARSENVALV